MAMVLVENVQSANVLLTVRDEHSVIKTLKVPGARKNDQGQKVHGSAIVDSSFIDFAVKNSKVAKSFFDRRILFVKQNASGPSEVKTVDFNDDSMLKSPAKLAQKPQGPEVKEPMVKEAKTK